MNRSDIFCVWFSLIATGVHISSAGASDLEVASGKRWYEAVGATPFDRENALDIVDFCVDAEATDDDSCVRAWVSAARTQGKHLFASRGDYTLTYSLPMFDGLHLRCASPKDVVFRQREGVWRPHFGFVEGLVRDVSVEGCSFDMRGNPTNFAHSFGMRGAERITFRGNRIFDSIASRCTARSCQRQYLVVLESTDILIADNHFSGGGRIKVGRPGRRIVVRNNFLEFVNDNGISVVGQSGAAWPDGTNLSEDILIDGNTIVDALSAGVFFGADGEPYGAGVSTRGVTIINNVVVGNTQLCIIGTLPDHASDIFVGNNRCLQSSEERFNAGITIKRSAYPAGAADQITVWGNYVKSAQPATLENGAYFVSDARACLVDNVAKNVARPTFFQPTARVFQSGNDWLSAQRTRAGVSCFVPDFLTLSLNP